MVLWRAEKARLLQCLERWDSDGVTEPAPSVRSSEEYLACPTVEAPGSILSFFLPRYGAARQAWL